MTKATVGADKAVKNMANRAVKVKVKDGDTDHTAAAMAAEVNLHSLTAGEPGQVINLLIGQ